MKKAINNFNLTAWNNQDDIDKYESLIDMCTVSDKTYVFTDMDFRKLSRSEKIKRLENKYIYRITTII